MQAGHGSDLDLAVAVFRSRVSRRLHNRGSPWGASHCLRDDTPDVLHRFDEMPVGEVGVALRRAMASVPE